MLKFGEWTSLFAYADRDAQITAQGSQIRAAFRDRKYTVVKLLQPVEGIQADHFYRIRYRAHSENMRWDVLYIWQDATGIELSKGYLQNEERLTSPANAAKLIIEVLLTGKGEGSFELSDLHLQDEGPYQPRNVKVCAVAYELLNKDLAALPFEENVALNLREIDAVAHLNPDVIVLTECAFQTSEKVTVPGVTTPNRLDDPHMNALCRKAKEYHCYIVTSLRLVDEDGVLHNSAILIDRQGNIQGVSHKTHLTINEKERGLELGQEFPVFDTDFGKIGMLVCWEHFFPEAVRTLALKGAEMIFVPTHGFRLNRAATRALENGVYLVTAHIRGDRTVVLDPDGRVLADGTEKDYAFAQVDLNKRTFVQYLSCSSWGDAHSIYLNERRPELYFR
ncbi:MAG: carbon-nitrogen hydrolase family protein [Ruminococcaceae bacterium]|nr:carbon-nitrogen hydrolase family protein [Oscillospiraceae bacterium]